MTTLHHRHRLVSRVVSSRVFTGIHKAVLGCVCVWLGTSKCGCPLPSPQLLGP